ncbi:unnamed protein product [Ceratitis capitata]|uniref:(Mediterranean fruit fly) hypothetical protein n=1 Tax=Ceratitis capitata TaxID=7213 RepID=A0A811V0Z2_CERCA|nr:unnamed protein product [Ceratitis capitata]
MDRIVSGIAKINFQQNCEDILVENRTSNFAAQPFEVAGAVTAMAECKSNDSTADSDNESEFNSSSETAIVGDDDADRAGSSNHGGGSLSQRRNLPRRACKENSMKLKRRSIMKPKRHNSRTCDFSMLRPAEIRKIYCNQKLTSFRPTNLETIFEEPQPEARRGEAPPLVAADLPLRFIGLRKIRRTLSCSDGLNINKTLIKQRRAKIKKIFGRRNVCKKISLNEFIDRMNKSIGEEADVEDTNDKNMPDEPMEAELSAVSVASIMTENENISSTKTEYTMPIEISAGNVHHCNNVKANEQSLFCTSNTFPNLSYSSSTADNSLNAAAASSTCVTGIR